MSENCRPGSSSKQGWEAGISMFVVLATSNFFSSFAPCGREPSRWAGKLGDSGGEGGDDIICEISVMKMSFACIEKGRGALWVYYVSSVMPILSNPHEYATRTPFLVHPLTIAS